MDFSELLKKFKRAPGDLVGVDIGTKAIKAVRMRRQATGGYTVTAAGIMELPTPPDDQPPIAQLSSALENMSLPGKLKARNASIALSGSSAIVKLLSYPGRFDSAAEEKIIGNLGIQNPEEFRISYRVLEEGRGRSESRVLAVAISEEEAETAMSAFSVGLPAPFSLGIAELASLTAFASGPLTDWDNDAIGFLEFGGSSTLLAFFNKGKLSLIRQFNVGSTAIEQRVQRSLGVDKETARGIMRDGAFDISKPLMDICQPLIRQLAVSRDFIERREDCRIGVLYVNGSITQHEDVMEELRTSLDAESRTWNPFDHVNVSPNAIPEALKGQEWRLSSALGACLATQGEE
ncbi:MAG: pilus assembly protein PilM [Kiritimatiellae bacterium]|nr:pilus assembly protein PilM [Kiritimatiellia bacterium]